MCRAHFVHVCVCLCHIEHFYNNIKETAYNSHLLWRELEERKVSVMGER